jgi:tRNA pseudouridine13 synthase
VHDGLFHTALCGDIFKKAETGGLFTSDTPDIEQLRLDHLEIDPTGPIYGPKMKMALADAAKRETAVRDDIGLAAKDWETLGRLGKGSRRVARIRPKNLQLEIEGNDLFTSFELPSGSYATVIVAELTHATGHLKLT